jgi:hypothetical protein
MIKNAISECISFLRAKSTRKSCIRALLFGKQSAKKSRFGFQTEYPSCGRDGMVDIPDLKSVGRMPVWVRLPPPAPFKINNLEGKRQGGAG